MTFRVSDVVRDTDVAPKCITAREQLARLGWSQPEAFAISAEAIVDRELVHPLALAIDRAFNDQRPDAVWFCLAQSLATHIELHAETLRSRLVRHQGQLERDVRRDDFNLVLGRCTALPEHLRCAHQGADAVARVRAELAALP